jgi:predicted O-linked N-acetylglucosamine transferase (SPINDLY family)
MRLMAGLLERHDKSRFHLTGFSFGPETGDAVRQRVARAFDEFIDVREMPDVQVASLARERGIDIAVDLKGFTEDGRPGIFAQRAAPIQVNYLGFPGTMGAEYIDYIIGDAIVVPEAHRPHYTEKIACLPHCYQPNDATRSIAERPVARAEWGLPAVGFVFCCFNNNYKITPEVFDVWMRLLGQCEGSVLWLFEENREAAGNLRSEASLRGVDPDRLVFAPRLPLPEHLARHAAADLFLDTLPVNAHTTASDALWAGLPLLTRRGEAFAGRVAASLLEAAGLPELVTTNKDDYERVALDLATDPVKLRAIRERLAHARLNAPLFDGAAYARHLEAAYVAMAERYQAGLPPAHIHVPR